MHWLFADGKGSGGEMPGDGGAGAIQGESAGRIQAQADEDVGC